MDKPERIVCPYLGMDYKRETHFTHIEELHRCFRKAQSSYIEPKIQALYCLGPDFQQCKQWAKKDQAILKGQLSLPSGLMLFPVVAVIVISMIMGAIIFSDYRIARTSGLPQGVNPTIRGSGGVSSIEASPGNTQASPGPTTEVPTATVKPALLAPVVTPNPSLSTTRPRITHVVSRGETLYSIAGRYNVTVDSIVKANNLISKDIVNAGQILTIP